MSGERKYDLEERTAKFGEDVIHALRQIKTDHITKPLMSQLIRSSTSIGANYTEANGGESKKDFIHKCSICRKESRESKHFIRMLIVSSPEYKDILSRLWKEAHELTLIFGAITRKNG